MKDDRQELAESLDTLVEEIIARVEEVGLEQAGEEYWEKAKRDLNDACDRIAAYRKEHGIPESEL
ncbi:MAG TPA: hypothetical protein VGN56_00835 [Candidatus Paceibacterota bacterium]|jgi:hypothetical protein|nr:hypothetical protein [Candidatus Paceibacterota bacterium]